MSHSRYSKPNEDIERERKTCTFKPLELTHLLDGTPEKTRERRERERIFLSDPELMDDIPAEYLSHKEKYELGVKKACKLFKKVSQLRDQGGDVEVFTQMLSGMLGSAILKDGNPFAVHYVMFVPTIMGQGTPEQQAVWIGRAWNCEIIGTYAQTELGHGTFIRGLETTAHYDPKQEEFILNSPTLTSYKWWPGGSPIQDRRTTSPSSSPSAKDSTCHLSRVSSTPRASTCITRRSTTFAPSLGNNSSRSQPQLKQKQQLPQAMPAKVGQTANYAVVVAQLYTQGVRRGVHPFIVQLRDEETHKPLPGIKIGEIGTKLGMNATNNGYLGFENVRIPRENMLMKNAQVLEDGTYVKSPSDKLTYGTMVFVRVVIVQDVASYLAKAVTIAVRYSAVRRQSELKPGEPEPQIIDYRTQQYKLFPNIATCFAMRFAARRLWNIYNNVTSELEEGDLDRLPELHAISCCLKAVCSSDASTAIETCRLACGGHGYMTCSNLPATYGLVTAACTYEGENTVLLLQTARFLMKSWQQAASGIKLTPTVEYLQSSHRSSGVWDRSIEGIIRAHQDVAAGKIRLAAGNMASRIKSGISPEDAWNMTSIELAQCAAAHCRCILVNTFWDTLKSLEISDSLRSVLAQLCELYGVYWLLQNSGDFLRFSSLTAQDIDYAQQWLEKLLEAIRRNAVGIVDGFDICDEVLSSALGVYDGRVYERLFEEAAKSPLNKEPVNESFHKYLKPFLKSNM